MLLHEACLPARSADPAASPMYRGTGWRVSEAHGSILEALYTRGVKAPRRTGGGMTRARRAPAHAATATLISNRCREEAASLSPRLPLPLPLHPAPPTLPPEPRVLRIRTEPKNVSYFSFLIDYYFLLRNVDIITLIKC